VVKDTEDAGSSEKKDEDDVVAFSSPREKMPILPVYWINLDRSQVRRHEMDAMLSDLQKTVGGGLKSVRIPAVDTEEVRRRLDEQLFIPNGIEVISSDVNDTRATWEKHLAKQYLDTEAACLLSHLDAIFASFTAGDELALIIEDDAVISEEFLRTWQNHAALAPQDWSILQWHNDNEAIQQQCSKVVAKNDPWLAWQPDHYGTTGYMINRKGMKEVLAKTLLRFQSSSAPVWFIKEPEVVVADEVIYFLAEHVYTSSYPWLTPSGLESTIESSREHSMTQFNDRLELKSLKTRRDESILVVTSSRLRTEQEISMEFHRLQIDAEALAQSHSRTRWIVNLVVIDDILVAPAWLKASELPDFMDIRIIVNREPFNKFSYFDDVMLQEFKLHDYVLIKDADIRLAGFPWNTFMDKKGNALVSGPLSQSSEESLLRNLGKPRHQYFQFRTGHNWKRTDIPDFLEVIPMPTMFIEQQIALLCGDFAQWFFEQALTLSFMSQYNDWGLDKMWCGAAQAFRSEGPHCYVVPVVFLHGDTRQIAVDNPQASMMYNQAGFDVIADFRTNDVHRAWMDASIGWDRLVGGGEDIGQVLAKCEETRSAKGIPLESFNLTTCTEIFIHEK
jgi:GR25 family glycosyltransferase involved in LPS biosynthesis